MFHIHYKEFAVFAAFIGILLGWCISLTVVTVYQEHERGILECRITELESPTNIGVFKKDCGD